ncbi:MAG: response regulator transcription factor [Ignavibacteriae bacterium]|nr:response regulator transcription factor [Ignavibacteriota bacterium]
MRTNRDLQLVIAGGNHEVRSGMRALLAIFDDIHVVADCVSAEEVRAVLASSPVDLLILDTDLPDRGGLELLGSLTAGYPGAVIFTSSSTDQAVAAFQFHPVDFLMQPVDGERLLSAVSRVRGQLEARYGALALAARMPATRDVEPKTKRLMVKSGGRISFVKAEEIDWIEADRDYVRLYNGQKKHLLRGTISGMERQLQGERFIRIHRSTIVNVDRIREMQPLSYGEYAVILHDGTRLTLSRSFRERVFEHMMTAA